mgnify:FL=1|jgi:predicted neutral ceramidase superfamily lipid hydrolase|tara:strand:- start:317 stop:544 length:228 start_codon:yes stop_codon:yes gene_type:complete
MAIESDNLYINIPMPSVDFINFFISLFWTLLSLYAIYLSFKCNKGGFNIGHFLAALFFAPFYVIYQFANNFEDCK